jgi:NAD(P)-dependent dehydrogenase (short-subunit alcohol dehydrogenase family)
VWRRAACVTLAGRSGSAHAPLDSAPVSKSPLRRFADQLTLASMRPPISPQVLVNRLAIKPVDLDGKRILLTGASSGIGEAAAEQLARHGATVVAVARRQDLLEALADRITTAGGAAMSIPCDVSDMDAVDTLVADVEKRIGGVDILVNNAGRSIRRPLAESLERWHDVERTMVLNYYAPLRLIRGLAPGMLERGDGHIINVSTWGVLSEASPLFAVYNASKAALSAVSRVVETEWGRKGVHSTTLYYPLVATPMIAPTKAYEGMPALTSQEAAEWMVTAARTRPVRIAPRMAIAAKALDTFGPRWVNALMQRRNIQPNHEGSG